MYKTLGIAVVLLAAFAFTSGRRFADASPATPISPPIVARGKLVNQTAPIPTTTIFTPTQTGLYRLTVYATLTQTDPASQSYWCYAPQWTDDSGTVQNQANQLLCATGGSSGPFEFLFSNYLGGTAMPFEAKAGTPITYNITQIGSPDNSAYSLYWTLERLE